MPAYSEPLWANTAVVFLAIFGGFMWSNNSSPYKHVRVYASAPSGRAGARTSLDARLDHAYVPVTGAMGEEGR